MYLGLPDVVVVAVKLRLLWWMKFVVVVGRKEEGGRLASFCLVERWKPMGGDGDRQPAGE